ncbi:AraC family transcriptional regulator [Elizabethkingia sp. JS20170427COW]|uniref:helix-turn-helix domain-containing protein n=1 Tax=Elizabethkingia sp. JS20170427COW TaxID=2583851 RepID=UPI00143DAA33|nr:AraC family transcriptional regulator [Elizabethkingia sp. JS20170427COW]
MQKNDIILLRIHENSVFTFNENRCLQLIWLNKGKVKLKLDWKEYPLQNGEIYMLLPNANIEMETYRNSEVIFLSFPVEMVKLESQAFAIDVFKLFVNHNQKNKNLVTPTVFHQIQHLSELMFQEKESAQYSLEIPQYSLEILWSYLKIILLQLIRDDNHSLRITDKNIERLEQIFTLISEYAVREKKVDFYAQKMNLSSKRLNQILQSLTGKNLSYYLQEQLILEAKRLLIKGKLSVNEIAYQLGYEDRAYFSRFLKKWTGIPPSNYKQMYFKNNQEILIKKRGGVID